MVRAFFLFFGVRRLYGISKPKASAPQMRSLKKLMNIVKKWIFQELQQVQVLLL